jgi:hypothetical protein
MVSCVTDNPPHQYTPLGWLYRWFKVGKELIIAEQAMRDVLGIKSVWATAPKINGCISSLLLWEIRAKQYLNSKDLAEVLNAVAAKLGYNQFFDYYESEEPDRGHKTPNHAAAGRKWKSLQAPESPVAPASASTGRDGDRVRPTDQDNSKIVSQAYAALHASATVGTAQAAAAVNHPPQRRRPIPKAKSSNGTDALLLPDQPSQAPKPARPRPIPRRRLTRRRPS